nr:ribonuclease H-like domain-containing protein [Tanacetum cinerariifolium]
MGFWASSEDLRYGGLCSYVFNSESQKKLQDVKKMKSVKGREMCSGYEVSKYIHGFSVDASTSTPTPLTPKELKVDNIVLSWIFTTPSNDLQASNEDVVTFTLEGLSDKYDHVCSIMHHKDTFLDLKTAYSMITTEEMRIKSKSLSLPVDSSSSSPLVLMVESGIHRRPLLLKLSHEGRFLILLKVGNSIDDLIVKLLSKLGLDNTSSGPAQQAQSVVTSCQATTLPHAFTAETLHDPAPVAWNMDTCASSYLNNSITSLCENFNTWDLNPVMAPSPIPHVFLVSHHMWYQRLGHPRSDVLRHLVSNNFISCNKEKPHVLYHPFHL